jgi:type IX secretion system PorP/SprF family membrane protein
MRRLKEIKYLVALSACLFFGGSLSAQQKTQFTQYVINEYSINPALSGIENYTDVKIGHRIQWVGLQGAPVTTYLTIQGPIGKQDYKTNATTLFPAVDGDNPRGKQYWDDYTASPAHHGIGLQISNDVIGPFSTVSVFGTYAYHMPISKKTNLSAGIGIGATKISLDPSKTSFVGGSTTQQTDAAVASTSNVIGKTNLDMNAGLWLYSADYFVGFAAQQLLPQGIDFSDPNNPVKAVSKGKMIPHFFTTVGYRFLLGDDLNVLPSVMVKSVVPLPSQVDLNVKFTYKDNFWFGGTYRGGYGFAAFAGFNALSLFSLSYSYDYSTTPINTVSSGTHEIILGFILGNKYSDNTCPRNVW